MKTIFLLALLSFGLLTDAQENEKTDIKSIYYINQAGEKIEGDIDLEEEFVYLVIESSNSIGKEVLLTMNEGEEFFYENQLLLSGSSVTFPITEDIQKVKLTIYNPRSKKHFKKRKKIEGFKKAKDAKG